MPLAEEVRQKMAIHNNNTPSSLSGHFQASSQTLLFRIALFFVILLPGIPARSLAQAPPVSVVAVIPPDAPPTYFLDRETNKPAGFAVDIMNAVAERSGLRVEYVFGSGWADIIEMVKNGKADLAPGMGVSKDRKKDLAFSALIDTFPVSFFVRSEHPGIDARAGIHAVGVIKGSVAFEKLQERADLRLVTYDGFGQGLFDLLSGKIEAFACPLPTLWQLANETGVEDHIKVVDRPIIEIKRAIAVRKANRELLDRVNTAVESFVRTPAYQQTYAKWYGRPTPYWTPRRTIVTSAVVLVAIIAAMVGWRYLSVLRLNRELTMLVKQREQAQEALRSSNAFNQSIIDSSRDCIKTLDLAGRLHSMSLGGQQILGIQNIDKYLNVLYEDFWKGSDNATARIAISKAQEGHTGTFQGYCPTVDGTPKWWDVVISPIIGNDGRPERLLAVSRDITAQKRATEALHRSEEKYRMLYDSAIDAIFILDLEGRFIDLNRTAYERLGYTYEEMLSMRVSELDPPEFVAQVATRLMQLQQQGHSIMTSAHRRKNGMLMPVEINARVIDYDGRKAIFSIVRDITERKQAEQEREKLITELQKLLSEIKTLHGILPICSSCKKIRDDEGSWHQLEAYISAHTDSEFSHGLCMECAKKLYPEYYTKDT